MPKINVYLPDDLAADVKAAGITVSAVCQRALEEEVRKMKALESLRNDPEYAERVAAARERLGKQKDESDQRHEDGKSMGLSWGFGDATWDELQAVADVGESNWIAWRITEEQYPTLYHELTELGMNLGPDIAPGDPFVEGFIEGATEAMWAVGMESGEIETGD